MWTHYEPVQDGARFFRRYRLRAPQNIPGPRVTPASDGLFLRRPPGMDDELDDESAYGEQAGRTVALETVVGRWGMIPYRTLPENVERQFKLASHAAAAEKAMDSLSFGGAWRRGQRCIVPVEALYSADLTAANPVTVRIARRDGEPMGIAGLWDVWRSPAGLVVSFAMLTVAVGTVRAPRRAPVILPDGAFDDWLDAAIENMPDYLQPYPSDRLTETPAR